jgi:hypothetical protein
MGDVNEVAKEAETNEVVGEEIEADEVDELPMNPKS